MDANTVAELLDGTLLDLERRSAEEHIDYCPDCRHMLAGLATQLSLIIPSGEQSGTALSHYARGWLSTMHSEQVRAEHCLEPGQRVDHYIIEGLLGRGGMGEVYLARDTKLDREVAIKVVNLVHPNAGRALESFMQEARNTARLNHPHIVTVYAVGEHEGTPYLALEYVQGQSLRKWLRNHAEGELREGLRIVLSVAEALQEAHRRGILHRDLKPENVLIDDSGRVRVVDFGLAVRLEVASERSTVESNPSGVFTGVVGTPRYMAPEQWTDSEQGEAVDIWPLGVILYELASGGRHPSGSTSFKPGSVVRLAAEASSTTPVAPLPREIEVSKGLRQLITRCLDKDASGRPSADEVVAMLTELLADDGGRVEARRRGSAPILGMIVGAAIVGAGFTFLLSADRAEPGREPGEQVEASLAPTRAILPMAEPAAAEPVSSAATSVSSSVSAAPTVSASAKPRATKPALPPRSTPSQTPNAPTSKSADPLGPW